MSTTVTDQILTKPNGVVYRTTVRREDFEFGSWGSYNVIGFLGERYFAGYVNSSEIDNSIEINNRTEINNSTDIHRNRLFYESDDKDLLFDNKLLEILLDDDSEITIASGDSLMLEEGYELTIESIDTHGDKIFLELFRDGLVVDSQVISLSNDSSTGGEETYCFKKDVGGSKDVVIIAVHFKNAFHGSDNDMAAFDGLWQLSEIPQYVFKDMVYGLMTNLSVTKDGIIMRNEDYDIDLNRSREVSLMPGIIIRSNETQHGDVRYYIYKEITDPGTYEIRSDVAGDSYSWTAEKFAGFYYDIENNISTEELTAKVTDGKLLEPDGLVYKTTAQRVAFEFEEWGFYNVIAFIGEKYFSGYIENTEDHAGVLFEESDDVNTLDEEQLLKILVDEDSEKTLSSDQILVLEEGYEIVAKSIDVNGKKVCIELFKDGQAVERKVVSASEDATISERIYCYRKDIGASKDMVVIAAHVKNIFMGSDDRLVTFEGLWQISDTPFEVHDKTKYGNMTVQSVTAERITMSNEDLDMVLGKNREISIMPGVSIRTADADELRYYIFKEATIADEGYGS
ncbi:MAG: S-layer protein domain-containing protein [Methanothrix sp.]